MHWTELFFVKHGKSYIKTLESIRGRAVCQTDALERVFDEQGVPKGGCILDLCCGIGRHSVLLAAKGYDVVGVDISPDFIERAKDIAKEEGVEDNCLFQLGDMRKIDGIVELDQFDAVINIFSSMGYYDDETEIAILRRLNKVTKTGGVLIIDSPNRDWMIQNMQPVYYDAEGEGQKRIVENRFNLETSQLERKWTIYRENGDDLEFINSADMTMRLLSLHERIRFFDETGWGFVKAYGSFELEPFKLGSVSMISVAKKES